MRKTKTEKGITLVALIITIVVLLILAVVSIRAIQGEGILTQAKKSGTEYNKAQVNEGTMLQSYIDKIEENIGNKDESTDPIVKIQGKVLDENKNTEVQDEYGNKIVVPAGFMIRVDETTNYASHVNEGIVIEDVSAGNAGSQFVWVPVGTVYTNKEKTTSETIELKRYVFNDDGTINEELSTKEPDDPLLPTYEGDVISYAWYERAINIEDFISSTSAQRNAGYYIGRYEARDGVTTIARSASTGAENKMVCEPDKFVYNYVTQSQSLKLSQNMYKGKETNYTSDLVNGFAWDTAIVFIQKCGVNSSKYSIQTSLNDTFAEKGTNNSETKDIKCNIYDLASNTREFSTEYHNGGTQVIRGGSFNYLWTGSAGGRNTIEQFGDFESFRPILYLSNSNV